MMSQRLFIWLLRCSLLLWLMFVQIDAACVCNEKGTDYCAACNDRVIVRPKQKYYDTGDISLPPIGDNCWCSKLMVEPAALPKPCPKYPKPPPPPSCGCNSYPSNNYPSYSTDYSESSNSYYPLPPTPPIPLPTYDSYVPVDKPKDDSPPADPISVSLALRAGKAIEVPEAKLAYGFIQKPIDGLKKVYFSNVPEENLFKLQGDVITLQRPEFVKRKYDDKYMDEIEEEEVAAGADDEDAQPHFTYKQLGYVAEEFKNPKFREVSRGGYGYGYDNDGDDGYGKRRYDNDGDDGYGKRRYDNDGGKPVYEKVSVDCGCKSGRAPRYRKRYPSKPRPYTSDYS